MSTRRSTPAGRAARERQPTQSIWYDERREAVCIIDQRALPHRLVVERIDSHARMCTAIRDMHLRGAPLIGVAASYGLYLAVRDCPQRRVTLPWLQRAADALLATRPTAVNLAWAVARALQVIEPLLPAVPADCAEAALQEARRIEAEDIETCRRIGEHGLPLLRQAAELRRAVRRGLGTRLNILTHCNAGWLACVRHGTATAPIYAAHEAGIPLHVWVDETRPRNQGAGLTAWELGQAGVPHTVIVDNAGGHLMQHGLVDLVIVGSDRTTRRGDVANKIGTYIKALAALDNGLPFYVALPFSSIDLAVRDGLAEIPIEERGADEVHWVSGLAEGSKARTRVRVTPEASPAANYAFDVTPARLVTALITERGVCPASEEGIAGLMPGGGSA